MNTVQELNKYREYLVKTRLSPATIERKLSSVRSYRSFLEEKRYLSSPKETANEEIERKLEAIGIKAGRNRESFFSRLLLVKLARRTGRRIKALPKLRYTLPYALKYSRPKWFIRYQSTPIARHLNLALLVVFCVALGIGGYEQFLKKPPKEGVILGTAPVSPPQFLSFQGRLTDTAGDPITAETHFRFSLYTDQAPATDAAQLYEEPKWITPDQDGIFNTYIGDSTALSSDIFKENTNLWLGVTVNTNAEMTDRQQVATVGYAFNSQFLQGYGVGSSGANINEVPVINGDGNLIIAAAGPMLQTTSGTFKIESPTLALMTGATSGNMGIGTTNPTQKFQVNDSGSSAFVITSTGTVGIGTTSPSQELHVVGDIRVTGGFYDSSNNIGGAGYVLTSTGVGTSWTALSGLSVGNADTIDALHASSFLRTDASSAVATGNTLTIDSGATLDVNGNISIADTAILLDGASTDMTATGNLSINTNDLFVVKSSGNVGIGNTFALQTLHVFGDVNVEPSAGYRINNTATSGQYLRGDGTHFVSSAILLADLPAITAAGGWTDGGTNVYLTAVTDSVAIGGTTPGTAKLAVMGGSVGIGTTSPTQALDINGNLRVSGGYYDSDNQIGTAGYLLSSTGVGTSWTALSGLSVGNASTFDGLDSLQFLRSDASDTFDAGNTLTLAGTLDVDGDAYFGGNTGIWNSSGNVGIGTTGPLSYKLEIEGSGTTLASVKTTATGADTYSGFNFANSTSNGGLYYFSTGSSPASKMVIANNATAPIIFQTDVVDRLTITGTGYVGIGTSSPTQILDVAGNLRIRGGLYDTSNQIGTAGYVLTSTGVGTSWSTVSTLSVGNADTVDALHAASFLRTDADSSVGAGFTLAIASGATLTVGGDLAITDTDIALNGATTNLAVTGDFSINTNDLFVVKSSGNVGIGNTFALQTLHVFGDVNVEPSAGYRINNTATSGQYLRGDGTHFVSSAILLADLPAITAAGGWTDGGTNVYLTAVTDSVVIGGTTPGTAKLVVLGGNIGIGTTSPTQSLHTIGSLRVEGGYYDSGNQIGTAGYVLTSTGTGTSWSSVSSFSVSNADTLDTLHATSFLRSDADSSVGVGYTLNIAPGATLDIDGDLLITDTSIALDGTSTDLVVTGNFSINSDDLYIDKATGAIGIGNTGSSSLFTVGPGYNFQVNSSGAIAAATGVVSSGNIDLSSLSAGGIVKAAVTTGRLSIAAGGTDYEYPLTFSNGLTRTTNDVHWGGTLSETTKIDTAGFNIGFMGTGYIGIGTTSPVSALDVNGGIISNIGNAGTDFTATGGLTLAGDLQLNNNQVLNSSGMSAIVLNQGVGDTDSNVSVNTLSGGNWLVENTTTSDKHKAALIVNQQMTDHDIFTASASAVPKFVINYDGNVGIGTVSPLSKMEVVSDSTADVTWPLVVRNPYASTTEPFGSGIKLQVGGASDTRWAGIQAVASGYGNNVRLAFYTRNTSDLAAERMRIDEIGRVGIGTSNPADLLTVNNGNFRVGESDSTGYLQLKNWTSTAGRFLPVVWGYEDSDTTGGGALGLVGQVDLDSGVLAPAVIVDGRNSASALSNRLIFGVKSYASAYFFTVAASGNVGIGVGTSNPNAKLDVEGTVELDMTTSTTGYVVCTTNNDNNDEQLKSCDGAGDIAEFYKGDGLLKSGDLVENSPDGKEYLVPSQTDNNQNLLGVVSTMPVIKFGTKSGGQILLALTGRVPAKVMVSDVDQPILTSDKITSSSLSGFGAKSTKAGRIVGVALDNFKPKETTCQQVNSVNEIVWPEDPDGTNQDKQCFQLPDGKYVAKIMVLINLGWYDPDVYLTDAGDLSIINEDSPYSGEMKLVKSSTGEKIDRIIAAGTGVIAKLRAGLIETTNLIAQNIVAEEKIITPTVETANLRTDIISPLSDNIVINLSNLSDLSNLETGATGATSFGQLLVKGIEDKTVFSLDASGNATFSGDLVAKNASFSGELVADSARIRKLRAEQIEGLEAIIASSSSYLSNLSDLSNLEEEAISWPVTDPSGDIKIEGNVSILGATTLAQTIVSGPFTQDGTLLIDEGNSINVLGGTLYLQNKATGGIDLLAGKVTIDTTGNAVFEGTLTVKGELFANIIKPASPSGELVFDGFGKLLAIGTEGIPVFLLDASGSAEFAGEVTAPSFRIAKQALALETDAEGILGATASAGLAKIPAERKEITIRSPFVSEKSLIYLTPVGSTGNQVLYLARIDATDKTFTAAIDGTANEEIVFSWWIVN